VRSITYPLSKLVWTTHSGSNASFNVESCLSVIDKHQKISKNYYLASSVLAGNMYAEGILLKKPAYHFQLLLTDEYHRVLRRPVHPNVETDQYRDITDTINDNSYFGSIASKIVYSQYQIVTNEMEFIEAIQNGCNLRNIKINIDLDQGRMISLESPGKHYNYVEESGKWQIETGPILFLPSASMNYASNREVLELLSPAFVHVNSFSNAYCTTEYPFRIDEDPIRLDCRIELLVSTE
jgi:hypothetical protein